MAEPQEDKCSLEMKAYAADALAPFTEEATRKEGRQLVIASAVTILLALNVVSVSEAAILGFKIVPSVPSLSGVAGGVTLYLFILYLLDLYRDRAVASCRRQGAKERAQLIQQQNDIFKRTYESTLSLYEGLVEELDQKLEQNRVEWWSKFRDQMQVSDEEASFYLAEPARKEEAMARISEARARASAGRSLEDLEQEAELLRKAKRRALEEQQVQLDLQVRGQRSRVELVSRVAGASARAETLRFLTEVIMPSLLALIALAAVLYRLVWAA